MKELYPTNLLSTPTCLAYKYCTNRDCEIITNSYGIRQVKVPEGLANIITNSAYRYSIEVYHPSAVGVKYTNAECTGCYTNTGPPLVTTIVENPDTSGNTTNRLKVTDGWGVVSEYEWKTNGWELVKGGGSYKKTRMAYWSGDYAYRTNTVEVRNETNGLVSYDSQKYQAFSFATNLVEAVTGEGTAALTNTFAYYTNTANLTGMLHQVTFGTGGWELYEYHTNLLKTNVCFPFLNQGPTNDASLCRSFSYYYASNVVFGTNIIAGSGDEGQRWVPSPRCVVERVLGTEVARTYSVFLHAEQREIRCKSAGAAWNAPGNLVTILKWYDSSDANNYGRIRSFERPDGTMNLYSYTFGTNGGSAYRTNTILSGVPNGSKTDIIDGEKTTEVVGHVGQKVSLTVIDIGSGIITSQVLYTNYDSFNRPRTMQYLDGTSHWTDYGCCGPVTETNREGTTVIHYFDDLRRRAATKQNNITQTNILDSVGNVVRSVRIGSDSSQLTQASYKYDSSGRRIASTNALNQATVVSETITNNQLVRTTTYPDGGTRIETYYRDGQLAKVTGTAVHPVRYDYGVENDGSGKTSYFTKEIKLDGSGNDTSEWTKTYRDMLGRSYKTVHADGTASESFYNSKGQLVKQTDPDGVTTLHAYNAHGELEGTATDMDRDGVIDFDGTDRIRQTSSATASVSSQNVRQTRSYAWATNNSAISNLVSESRVATDGLQSWTIQYSQVTNHTRTQYAGTGNRYVTNTAPDGSYAISHYLNGLLQSVTRKNSSGIQLSQMSYAYDAHGRQSSVTDARNGATTYAYNNADRVSSTTTPPPGNGQSPQTTSHEHDWAGRIIRTVLPDGTSVTNEYHLTGELKKTCGSRNYPVQYGYDAQGRRTNMITWKNFTADSGKATTVWKFDGYRGFLTNKVYDDGQGPVYTYTPAGRMRTRTWARGVVTTYHTNAIGEVFATTYSDSTPAVTNNFDRLGRRTNIIDGAGSRFLVYDSNGQLLSETNSSGTLLGANLRFAYDQYLRRTNHQLLATNTSLLSHSFAFDGASRITNVSEGTYQAGYSYLANSPLVTQISYRSNSTTRMTTTKSYDFLNRLSSISSQPSASGLTPIAFGYSYNDANQRTRVNMADGSFWVYEYDKLGQVISGKRYWNDWTPVAGQQYEYAFDDIGNRTSTKAGGDAVGASLRLASYSANNLNQYTSRDVPAYLNVLGIAHANASVTVNSQSPYRRGEYYRSEINSDNSVNPVWQSITNVASLSGTSQTNTGNLFLPKTAESYTYDLDGNLTSDGRWTNQWDAENRLIDLTSHSSGPSASRKSLQFAYDSGSRRYSKVVSNWTGSAWTRALHELYLYDGWNLLGTLNGTNNAIVRSFLWGLDLSGSLQGAGGVGGLLFFTQYSNSPPVTYCSANDGNGNVVALVDGSTGAASARYEYDPFGQTIRANGAAGTLNPIRFSSKPTDEETDLAYYGYRYLDSNRGRWLNRDPIEERGGRNVYSYVLNNSVSFSDPLGLCAPRCGVNSLTMFPKGWEINQDSGGVYFTFDIVAWLKRLPEYDWSCCRYVQWVSGHVIINGTKVTRGTGNQPLEDDEGHLDYAPYAGDSIAASIASGSWGIPLGEFYDQRDKPGYPGNAWNPTFKPGDTIDIYLRFVGNIVDRCHSYVVRATEVLDISAFGTYPNLTVSP